MTVSPQTISPPPAALLLRKLDGFIIERLVYAAAKLGIADLLSDGPRGTTGLAQQLSVNEPALYRMLRALASQGIFEENGPRSFTHTELSRSLCAGVPGSIRSLILFRGGDFVRQSFGKILYSIETGKAASDKLFGSSAPQFRREHGEMAALFDQAMTEFSALAAAALVGTYDFGAWGSLMDLGGGNGFFLAAVLKAYPGLRGVLADLPDVVERALQRGFLAGELASRSSVQSCDFFQEVPAGCRAYLLKTVILDWNDEQAHRILVNCRKAVPDDGVLLLIDFFLTQENGSSSGALLDIPMLVLTGGQVRTIDEIRQLAADAGFRLNRVISTPAEYSIIEALPV